MSEPIVFISYSHKDEEWKDRLLPQVQSLERLDRIVVWASRQTNWMPTESELALASYYVAHCVGVGVEDSDNLYTFYEAPVFTARLERFAGAGALSVLYAIQDDLLADPLRWPVVKGTGGARKGRVADPASDRGKSGSYRYLYLYLEHRGQIYLLFLFAKTAQADLSAEQKKEVAAMVEAIKKM